jgi:integrase
VGRPRRTTTRLVGEAMPVRKRDDSPYWQIHIGRKTRISSGTEDYDEARELEKVLLQQKWKREKLGDRGAIEFDDAADRWLRSSASVKKRDREILDWLSPHIGLESVSDVAEPDTLEEIRKEGLVAGWSHSTIDRAMGTVCAVLKHCQSLRELDFAPKVPMYRPPKGEPRFLTPPELDRLCWQLPMHLALAARVAVHTLLRMRSMLKLTKNRVDLRKCRAWVPGAQQKAGRTFGLPLNSEAVRALRALWLLSPVTSPHIFTWQGKPIDDCNTLAFQNAVKRAELAPLRWHDLRHTGASWAVQSGVSLPELMLLGDWRDYRSVLIYAHLAPSQAVQAADRVAQWSHGVHADDVPRRAKTA